MSYTNSREGFILLKVPISTFKCNGSNLHDKYFIWAYTYMNAE